MAAKSERPAVVIIHRHDYELFVYEPRDLIALMRSPVRRANFVNNTAYEREREYRLDGMISNSFRGPMSSSECQRALLGDYPAGAAVLKAKIRRIHASCGASQKSSVVGSSANVGAYLAGKPDAMLAHRDTGKRVPCIRLVVVMDWSRVDTGDDVQSAMEALAPYVVSVELVGKQVEIWAAAGLQYDEAVSCDGYLALFKVKNFGERLNVGRTAFMLGTVDFHRKCGTFNVIVAERLGGRVEGHLGVPLPFWQIEAAIRQGNIPALHHAIALSARACSRTDNIASYINNKLEEEFLDLHTIRIS